MGERELRQSFLAALPDRIVGLEMACEQWRLAQHDSASEIERFCRLCHNLAGASALYGFEEVSAPARALECYLRALMRDVESVNAGDGEVVSHLLGSIREAVRQLRLEVPKVAVRSFK